MERRANTPAVTISPRRILSALPYLMPAAGLFHAFQQLGVVVDLDVPVRTLLVGIHPERRKRLRLEIVLPFLGVVDLREQSAVVLGSLFRHARCAHDGTLVVVAEVVALFLQGRDARIGWHLLVREDQKRTHVPGLEEATGFGWVVHRRVDLLAGQSRGNSATPVERDVLRLDAEGVVDIGEDDAVFLARTGAAGDVLAIRRLDRVNPLLERLDPTVLVDPEREG